MTDKQTDKPTDPPAETQQEQPLSPFPVVGIGASAGGLKAVAAFLDNTPADSGMAYVVVFHLDPRHKSAAAELLQRHTRMPVAQVSGRVHLEPDHVYVIPPGRGLTMADSALLLSTRARVDGQPTVIDRFFRALAQHVREHAIGVVLSGTGSEGSEGLKAIKEAGGLTVVQDETEAEYAGMPHSAIATGLIDFILPVAQIPAKLAEVKDFAVDFSLSGSDRVAGERDADILQKIFVQLRTRAGHDFSHYKHSTILRRIARRMQVKQVQSLADYLEVLRTDRAEAETLFREFLISVTNFFRDPEAMAALTHLVIAKMCQRLAEQTVRVWVPGCATGEEAYSLAMLLMEACDELAEPPRLQLFASDVDERALAVARRGHYAGAITGDVSPARLQRFFDRDGEGYVVKPALRETILFTRHDILQDPPFSRLDLISCRNLLIYLKGDIQSRVFALFHFALKQQGFLFLGTSESLGTSVKLFSELDHKARIFQARRVPVADMQLPLLPDATRGVDLQRRAPEAPRKRFEDLARDEMMASYAPPCVIVNENYDVAYVSGRVGRYLEPGSGAANFNVLDMAREGLRLELRGALYKVFHDGAGLQAKPVRVGANGAGELVRLTVRPLGSAEGHALVIFEPPREDEVEAEPQRPVDGEGLITQLETELSTTRESLQTTIEELETSNEEMRASNEEMQSVNEELQSTTEELETGKEELQSTNEELIAVNQELQVRNDQLASANSDLGNFISSADIGMLFLDEELRVRRYTPRMTDLFNLIASDVGRPLAHVTNSLAEQDLLADCARVLGSLVPVERELASRGGRFYQARVRPYRSADNKVGGVVLTFVDVSERHHHEAETQALNARLQAGRQYAENIIDTVREPLLVLDGALHVQVANRAFYRTFDTTPEAAEKQPFYEQGGKHWDIPELRRLLDEILSKGARIDDFEVKRDFGAGERVLLLNARRLEQRGAGEPMILLAFEDVTERVKAAQALRERDVQKTYLLQLSDAMRATTGAKERATIAMRVLAQHLGVDRAGYFTVDSTGEFADGLGGYADGQPPLNGRFRLADFGPGPLEAYAAGKPFVVADTAAPALGAVSRSALEARGIRSRVDIANVKEGRLRALVTVCHHEPRDWSPGDLALIEETAERTWAAIERAVAEQALGRSEEKYRALFETMGEGFGIVRRFERAEQAGAAAAAPDFRWIEHNAAFLALTQLVDPIDKPMGAGFPQDWTRACEIYGAILKSGEPKRFEVTLEPRDRVMEMYAFRLGGSDSDRIAVLFQDVTLRKRAEQRYKLLIHELNHRVRNNLAIVQALAAQTFRGTGCDAAVATFEGRLLALSAAHVALTAENWHGADILKILHGGLSAWIKTENPRIHIEGESLHVRPAAALALAMAVHELATNATKYGALATEQGAIDVRWSIVPGRRGDMLRWRWRERGGPAVVKPTRHGFGTWLIETGLARDLGGAVKLAFGAEGFTCTVEAPLAEISDFA